MAALKGKRPNMTDYFKARIDHHVHGMMSTMTARLPRDVAKVSGDVDGDILVTMKDGTEWRYAFGGYSARKVAGCYAPKMPKAI